MDGYQHLNALGGGHDQAIAPGQAMAGGRQGEREEVPLLTDGGERIVSGSDDRTAKLWETGPGLEVFSLKEHTEMVWSVAFSPDGLRIVTGMAGADATAKVWHAPMTPSKAAREQKVNAGGPTPEPKSLP